MKRLAFGTEEVDWENYKLLYEGLTTNTRNYTAPRETRTIGKVLDSFEAIGKSSAIVIGIKPDGTPVMGEIFLLNGGGNVDLEDAEYALAKESLAPPHMRWKAAGARRVTRAMEFFEAAKAPPEGEPDGAE